MIESIKTPCLPTLTVVSNSDPNFYPGLAVAIASAVAAASGRWNYDIIILDGGLKVEDIAKLSERVKKIGEGKGINITLTSLEVDQELLKELPPRRGSRMTYAKLILPEILPHLDSIIYLDADILCFSGIEAAIPPEGHYLLSGARDYFSVIENECPWIDQVPQGERKLPYINCGLMWMNLKSLRAMSFTKKAISARALLPNARQGDQSVFNFLCRGKSYLLPEELNHRTAVGSSKRLNEGNLGINIHYIGSPKPWLGNPSTRQWLAHQLWHQASNALFGEMFPSHSSPPPANRSSVWRKSILYRLLNPTRARYYSDDLLSLSDPSKIIQKAADHWRTVLS